MSFFDSKEEVINLELTQYGKYLLSKGKFHPSFYAFFDDDVVYDTNYANFSELQNSSETRILYETPLNKPTYSFVSVEKTFNVLLERYPVEDDTALIRQQQREPNTISENDSSLLFPLGSSSPNSQYSPAWQVNVLTGSIFEVKKYIDNSNSAESYVQPYLHIPQINMNTGSFLIGLESDPEDISLEKEVLGLVPKTQPYYITGEKIDLKNIFDIIEYNSDDNKENFELEVFIEENVRTSTGDIKKTWKKLCFAKDQTNIKNIYDGKTILLDEYVNKNNMNFDETYVEYFLDVLFDDAIELPADKLNALGGIYNSNITDRDKPFGENC